MVIFKILFALLGGGLLGIFALIGILVCIYWILKGLIKLGYDLFPHNRRKEDKD